MIIGLHGESRAGKDSVAQILQEKADFEWRAFATPLRTILCEINPYLRDRTRLRNRVATIGWDEVKEQYPESVEYMIDLGQSVRDLLHEDAWLWGALKEPLPARLVISDVRQENEYDAIRELDGEVWLVTRPGTTPRRMDSYLKDKHFDAVIRNDGTLDDLTYQVLKELKAYGNR